MIPETVTVHLGRPDAPAPNVTVPFIDYVKNVASSEIYPTWPENAIRANMYAQISFALNRIYTEYYRSRGYDFDITNSTAFDQYYVDGRDIFDNISRIADEIFNSYIVRGNGIEPYFAQYCSGTTVTCDGLSQWGTVALARQGLTPLEILRRYYGNSVYIRQNVPVSGTRESYPGVPLRSGNISDAARNVQIRLNRISKNYPNIPKISPVNGTYDIETENAVREFQRTFDLTPDGIVGPATWYKIIRIFNAVKRLNELNSEGLQLSEISTQFQNVLRFGDSSDRIKPLQYFLSYVGTYVDTVPPVPVTGYFGEQTRAAVIAFQRTYGLTPDGIVGPRTWNALYDAYRGIIQSLPDSAFTDTPAPFPGTYLVRGSRGEDVLVLQKNLAAVASVIRDIPSVAATGYFGQQTFQSVIAFQRLFGIETTGAVGPITWDAIASEASDITAGNSRRENQYVSVP